MIQGEAISALAELYDTDETAWLEQMAALAARGETAALDLEHLSAYLSDRAKRDKREVFHRLVRLLIHLLKWEYQPEKRTRSWELTIQEQREELQELLESGVLRNYADQQLGKAYYPGMKSAQTALGAKDPCHPKTEADHVHPITRRPPTVR